MELKRFWRKTDYLPLANKKKPTLWLFLPFSLSSPQEIASYHQGNHSNKSHGYTHSCLPARWKLKTCPYNVNTVITESMNILYTCINKLCLNIHPIFMCLMYDLHDTQFSQNNICSTEVSASDYTYMKMTGHFLRAAVLCFLYTDTEFHSDQ